MGPRLPANGSHGVPFHHEVLGINASEVATCGITVNAEMTSEHVAIFLCIVRHDLISSAAHYNR